MRINILALSSALFMLGGAGAAHADAPMRCGTMYQNHQADIDGPVVSVTENAKGSVNAYLGHHHIVVRDNFTDCRISDDTNSDCKVGQHAAITGGSLGIWIGDMKDTDTDFQYQGNHQWDCGQQ
jgi:hypothetical protein